MTEQIRKRPRQCVVLLDREWIFRTGRAEFRLKPRETQDLEAFTEERLSFVCHPVPEDYEGTYEGTLEQFLAFDLQSVRSSVYNTRMNTPFQPEPGNEIRHTKVKRLGDGSQGNVNEVVDIHTGDYYACKVIQYKPMAYWKIDTEKAFKMNIEAEVALLMKLRHVGSFIPALVAARAHELVRIISSHTCAPKAGPQDMTSTSSSQFAKTTTMTMGHSKPEGQPVSEHLNIKVTDNNHKVFSKIKRITILKKLMAPSARDKTFDDSRIQPTDSPNTFVGLRDAIASTPREEPDPDGQADQHKNNLVDPHDHSSLAAKQELSQGGRPLYHAYIEDADDSSVEQTSDDSQRSANLDVWPPSDHNNDTYDQDARQDKQPSEPTVTSSIPQRLDTPQHTSSKRKQHFEDSSASKRAHLELADAIGGGPGSNSAAYPTRWTYKEFALRYYMLVPSSSRTSGIRDMANKILTKVLGASRSEGLDKYQLGQTEIIFRADTLAFLENLRTTRLNHCATMIQKNLKAKYYRRKYLEARNAILLFQSATRRHLAWKHTQETRKIKAATTIQRVWRGQKQRKSFNAIRNNVISI
ncbi:uncharacterized protein PAC_09997 [Phialocephala subalpina]|uniref:Protein kinase domain-containing protein n=1 Tax=Phialocephala subalpina TaxID=576137 RepID=A0A1L7X506_9HELO|nr:uncharacterized protein PAC_09997 [Phialocephala subalpina]